MPELIEAELYRSAIDPLINSQLLAIELRDADYVRPKGEPGDALDVLVGLNLAATRRHGKLVLLDFGIEAPHIVLGLRFGMTGRLLIDGAGPIDKLEYSSGRNDPDWDRVRLVFSAGVLAVRDPRRLGSVELDPAETELGIDATMITPMLLGDELSGRQTSLKALLLNQKIVAGLGNLLVDEVLYSANLAPTRSAGELSALEIELLARSIISVVASLTVLGGSHTGPLFPERTDNGCCPTDGTPLSHGKVGGRGTWWCPMHQT